MHALLFALLGTRKNFSENKCLIGLLTLACISPYIYDALRVSPSKALVFIWNGLSITACSDQDAVVAAACVFTTFGPFVRLSL